MSTIFRFLRVFEIGDREPTQRHGVCTADWELYRRHFSTSSNDTLDQWSLIYIPISPSQLLLALDPSLHYVCYVRSNSGRSSVEPSIGRAIVQTLLVSYRRTLIVVTTPKQNTTRADQRRGGTDEKRIIADDEKKKLRDLRSTEGKARPSRSAKIGEARSCFRDSPLFHI